MRIKFNLNRKPKCLLETKLIESIYDWERFQSYSKMGIESMENLYDSIIAERRAIHTIYNRVPENDVEVWYNEEEDSVYIKSKWNKNFTIKLYNHEHTEATK